MRKAINVNVSGGTVAIGVVNQGDRGTLHGKAHISAQEVEQYYAAAKYAISELAAEFEKKAAEVQNVLSQLATLKAQIATEARDANEVAHILKTARDNFSWAYPALKDFVKALWPALLGTMAS